jgi:hypothetical protein
MMAIGYKRSERRRAALHARFDARDQAIDASRNHWMRVHGPSALA